MKKNMIRCVVVAAATVSAQLASAGWVSTANLAGDGRGEFGSGGTNQRVVSGGVSALNRQQAGASGQEAMVVEQFPVGLFSGPSGAAAGSSLIKNTPGLTVQNTSDVFDTVQVSNGELQVTGATTTLGTLDSAVAAPGLGLPVPAGLGTQVGQVAGQLATLTINGGAKYNGFNLAAGTVNGAVAVVNVDGAGTAVNMAFPAANQGWFVNARGTATFNITNGATVTARLADFGRESGTSSTVNISGVGSKLTTSQLSQRGGSAAPFDSNLTINVTDGGSLTGSNVNTAARGNMFFGTNKSVASPNTSILNVSGAGSSLFAGQLSLANGAGAVTTTTISNGATADLLNVFISGNSATTDAKGILNISGSTVTMSQLVAGNATGADGDVNVTSGSTVTAANAFFANTANATGSLTVSNSAVTTSQFVIGNGENASGTVNLSSGASLTTANAFISSDVTTNVGVTINGSTLKTSQMSVADGFGATATVELSNASTLDSANIFLSTQSFATSTFTSTGSTVKGTSFSTAHGEESSTTAEFVNSTVQLTNSITTVAPSRSAQLFGGKSTLSFTGSTVTVGSQIWSGFDASASVGENDTVTLNDTDLVLNTDGTAGSGQFVMVNGGGINSVWNVLNKSTISVAGNSFLGAEAGGDAKILFNDSSATFSGSFNLGGSGGTAGSPTLLELSNGSTVSAPSGTTLYGTANVNVVNSTFNAGGIEVGGTGTGGTITLTNATLGLSLNVEQSLSIAISGTVTDIPCNFGLAAISGTGTINKTGTALDLLNGDNTGFNGVVNIAAGAIDTATPFGSNTIVNNSSPGVTLNVLDGGVAATQTYAGLTYNTGGPVSLAAITQPGPLSGLTVVGATTQLTVGSLRQGSLFIFEGSSLTVSPGSPIPVQLEDLALLSDDTTPAPAAFLDLNDNSLVVEYTGASPILDLIDIVVEGTQLLFDGDVNGLPTYLAIAEAVDLGLTEFEGVQVDETTVLAKFTYVGDANLDGQVDALDYERVDLAIGNTGVAGTAQGDLNYDGNVDALDYEQIDLNIGNGVGAPLAAVFIPEPATLSLLLALPVLAGRRRR